MQRGAGDGSGAGAEGDGVAAAAHDTICVVQRRRRGLLGSWAYVQTHRAELDKIQAVIVFDSGNGRFTGYSMGGRHDLEAGVREVLKPLQSWDVDHHTADAQTGTDHLIL